VDSSGPRNAFLHGDVHWRHLTNANEPSVFRCAEWSGGDAAYVKLLWTLIIFCYCL